MKIEAGDIVRLNDDSVVEFSATESANRRYAKEVFGKNLRDEAVVRDIEIWTDSTKSTRLVIFVKGYGFFESRLVLVKKAYHMSRLFAETDDLFTI